MNGNKGLLFVVLTSLVALGVTLGVVYAIDTLFPTTAEIGIGSVIVLTIAMLMVLLYIMAAGLSIFNLTDRQQALGLPQGSVRAMIALFLIMVFVIFGVYLFREVASPDTTTLSGLTAAQIAELSADKIVAVREGRSEIETFDVQIQTGEGITTTLPGLTAAQVADLAAEDVVITAGEPVETFDVDVRVDISEEGARLAQQLLTTVGTLVVAVAGFYFGTRAVAAARGVAVPLLPVIRKIDPEKGQQGEEKEVTILGKNFASPKVVKLVKGAVEIPGEEITWSATKINCKFNLKERAAQKYDLVVVNEDGGEDRLTEAFTVEAAPPPEPAAPTLDKVEPSAGKAAAGEVKVTITGTGFAAGAKVELRKEGQEPIAAKSVTVVDEKKIECTFALKDKAAGDWDVVVKVGEKEVKKEKGFKVEGASA